MHLPTLLPLLLSALEYVSAAPTDSPPDASGILMPKIGSRPLTVHYLPLLSTRINPIAPTPNTPRNLMTTLYTPRNSACENTTYPYMPPETVAFEEKRVSELGLKPPTLSLLRQTNCTTPCSSYSTCPSPDRVLIFSPGFGATRHLYSSTLISVASSTNSLILALDHPYDTDIVEYPPELNIPAAIGLYQSALNGSFPGGSPNSTFTSLCLTARVEDVVYAFEKLPNLLAAAGWASPCIKKIQKLVEKKGVGLFGHSLGGATALAALEENKAFKAGMNWDGAFRSPPAGGFKATKKPFELVLAASQPWDSEPSFNTTWPLLKGYTKVVNVERTAHLSFEDGPAFADVLGARQLGPLIDQLVGEVSGVEMFEILVRIVSEFFPKFV